MVGERGLPSMFSLEGLGLSFIDVFYTKHCMSQYLNVHEHLHTTMK